MSKKLIILSLTCLLVFPLVALAVNPVPQPGSNLSIQSAINGAVSALWYIFIGISIMMFVWAGFLFVTAAGDPSKISTAKKAVLWGIVGVALALLSTSIPFILSDIFS